MPGLSQKLRWPIFCFPYGKVQAKLHACCDKCCENDLKCTGCTSHAEAGLRIVGIQVGKGSGSLGYCGQGDVTWFSKKGETKKSLKTFC